MSEYIVTVPERHLNQIYNGKQPFPIPELSQFWGSACPRLYTRYCISSASKFIFFKLKKKRLTDQPSRFSGQNGKQTLYFFRPKIGVSLCCFVPDSWCVMQHDLMPVLIFPTIFIVNPKALPASSSSSIGCGAGDHKVSPCTTIISKCGNLLFLHCSFIIPKQSLYIIKV